LSKIILDNLRTRWNISVSVSHRTGM
jgi:hypothetical protein